MSPDPKTIEFLESRGITVEVLRSQAAVDRYRALNPSSAAAELHLTCYSRPYSGP